MLRPLWQSVRRTQQSLAANLSLFNGLASAQTSSAVERKIDKLSRDIYENLESVGLYTSRSESEDVKQYVSGVITVLRKSEMHSMKSRNEKSDNSSDDCRT